MKRYNSLTSIITLLFIILSSCTETKSDQNDINDLYPEAQDELRKVVASIVKDCETANSKGLEAIHLKSDKFTKFGPRNFERQDVESANESEIAHFSSVSNFKMIVKDLKIDVFGDVGIATYYPNSTFEKDGNVITGRGRQTLVFLKTPEGWKIIHEHGTKAPTE